MSSKNRKTPSIAGVERARGARRSLALLCLVLASVAGAWRVAAAEAGLAGKTGARRLPPLSADEVFKAFGVYENNGRLVVQSDLSRQVPKRFNLLNFMPPTTSAQRTNIYAQSQCGKRGFQLMSQYINGDREAVNIIYPCDNRCLAIHEIHARDEKTWADKLEAVSEPSEVSVSLCEALWGGAIRTQAVGSD